MLVKNFKERKSIAGMKSTPKDTIFNIYTEIKNKRQELDGLIDVLTQYEERNNSLCLEITARTNELAEIENLIDLANEQLEAIIIKINHYSSLLICTTYRSMFCRAIKCDHSISNTFYFVL